MNTARIRGRVWLANFGSPTYVLAIHYGRLTSSVKANEWRGKGVPLKGHIFKHNMAHSGYSRGQYSVFGFEFKHSKQSQAKRASADPANEGAVALETFSLGGGLSEACLPVDPDASRWSWNVPSRVPS